MVLLGEAVGRKMNTDTFLITISRTHVSSALLSGVSPTGQSTKVQDQKAGYQHAKSVCQISKPKTRFLFLFFC